MPQVQENVAVEKATVTNATVGTSSAELVAANPQRVSVAVYNNGTATIYLDNSTASAPGSWPVPAGTVYENDHYVGAINAISGTAGQDVRVWEDG